MPEMPEVESMRRVLEPQLAGLRIEEVKVRRPEVVAHPTAAAFAAALEGLAFDGVRRRGKYLAFDLSDESRLVVHLRMTGCLLVAPPGHPEEKHTHVVFRLEDERELRFSDARRFGRIWHFRNGEPDELSGAGKLGIEPFDETLNPKYLEAKLSRRRKPIKECLLDQGVVAGIGNIYADEILFAARIAPMRPANTLTEEEWDALSRAIPERLGFFAEKGEMTPEEHLAGRGREYRNTPYLQAYGHAGDPCPVCGGELRRTVVGGRGSVYCPKCTQDPMNAAPRQ